MHDTTLSQNYFVWILKLWKTDNPKRQYENVSLQETIKSQYRDYKNLRLKRTISVPSLANRNTGQIIPLHEIQHYENVNPSYI